MKQPRPIRVLHLAGSGPLYGAERWILALIKNLDCRQVESLVSIIKDSPYSDRTVCDAAHDLGFHTQVFEAKGKLSLAAISKISVFIVENDIDIIHTHGYKPDIIGLLSTRSTHCKALTTPHGWSRQGGFKLRCYETLNRLIFPAFHRVVPLSEEIHSELRWIPGLKNKLRLIENGVDLDEIQAASGINEEILAWKSARKFVIGYIGQLVPRKGVDLLIQAVAKLNNPDIRLAVVGDGQQLETLQTMAGSLGLGESVKFFGFRQDRLEFLKTFDILVLPSRREGIPRCVMEAMGAGIPVVVSDIPGCDKLVRHGITGLLFKLDDHEALADNINTMLRETELRSNLGENGRAYIEGMYSARRMALEYHELYRSLAA